MTAITEATVADAAAVIALWHACDLTRPWNDPDGDFRRALEYTGSTVLIATRSGEIAGSAMTGFDGHRGWIYYLAVTPTRRGEGIASLLIDACCDWLQARDCPKVELMVRDGNPAAAFYDRLGWEPQAVNVYARWLAKTA